MLLIAFIINQAGAEPTTKALDRIGSQGVVGAFAVLFMIFIGIILKYMKTYNENSLNALIKKNEELEKRIGELEEEFREFMINEIKTNQEMIGKNTEALNNFTRVFEQLKR